MSKIHFFAHEYKRKNWQNYAKLFKNVNVNMDGVPQDIVNVVVGLLGEQAGYDWLQTPLNALEGKTASQLLKTREGKKALKAFIMRLPT